MHRIPVIFYTNKLILLMNYHESSAFKCTDIVLAWLSHVPTWIRCVLSCKRKSILHEEAAISVTCSLTSAYREKNLNFLINTEKARSSEGTTRLLMELCHENKIMAWYEFHLMQLKEINRKEIQSVLERSIKNFSPNRLMITPGMSM